MPNAVIDFLIVAMAMFLVVKHINLLARKPEEEPAPATRDCPGVERLRNAGGIIIGRTNLVEFALSGLGINPHYGELDPYAMAALFNRFQTLRRCPLLIAADFERGASMRVNSTTQWPYNMAFAATRDVKASRMEGAATAREARALGVDARLVWSVVIVAATLMTATVVSLAGIMAWVGLVVPHLARYIVGPSFARLLWASLLVGSIFLLCVDDLARTASIELPLGVLTAVIGAPFFVGVLARARNQWL